MPTEQPLVVASFEFLGRDMDMEGVFAALLMRWGPPPKGVVWQPSRAYPLLKTDLARAWVESITADCWLAIANSGKLDQYTPRYREMWGRQIKNQFLNWCRDGRLYKHIPPE